MNTLWPLTVTAHLSSPPILDRPLLLDGIVLGGLGVAMGASHPSGWVDEAAILSQPLPFARVETEWGWWYAASQVIPCGPESTGHVNRVPLVEEAGRWTTSGSINQATGPDKRLRVPYYTRPAMTRLQWTCVGDADAIGRALQWVSGLGRLLGHGHGWMTRWEVSRATSSSGHAHPLDAYEHDVGLRHLPACADLPRDSALQVTRRNLPLRPPYHARAAAVPCWQVQR